MQELHPNQILFWGNLSLIAYVQSSAPENFGSFLKSFNSLSRFSEQVQDHLSGLCLLAEVTATPAAHPGNSQLSHSLRKPGSLSSFG